MHRLWTFKVTGGGPFQMHPPGNPPAAHNGVASVFHFMLTDEQAAYVETTLAGLGCVVERRAAAEQSEEQRAERLALLGVGKTEDDFPSVMCPMCYWFDPTSERMCGRMTWPPETIEASLEAHEAARKGQAECPVREW